MGEEAGSGQAAVCSTPVLYSCREKSSEHTAETKSVCGCPAHGAGGMFAFPLGFHDVILPLPASVRSAICLWVREGGNILLQLPCDAASP